MKRISFILWSVYYLLLQQNRFQASSINSGPTFTGYFLTPSGKAEQPTKWRLQVRLSLFNRQTQGPFWPSHTSDWIRNKARLYQWGHFQQELTHRAPPPCPVAKWFHLLESEGAAFPLQLPFLLWKTTNNPWTPAAQPCPTSSLCHMTCHLTMDLSKFHYN